jgi:hypothetical protein
MHKVEMMISLCQLCNISENVLTKFKWKLCQKISYDIQVCAETHSLFYIYMELQYNAEVISITIV